ncbi:NUDIX hydrolase [Paenibacillus aurantius]|uniref:NUDIX hydrolase n=1 Tax=Paenibacillus aurantius TaxID=2918900 RepID=A0AA96LCM4_9BACL|nr:NUDIX hydrolase [Paenibacillus aurantius]WNQ10733.1 NUDIX hydrolase [Paenibacillus aurantius]
MGDYREERWHRHLGVYGICIQEGKLLLIHKKGGPYINRYDLPGGTVEPNEPLVTALHREVKEETGLKINVIRNLGVRDYVTPYPLEKRGTTHIHHIAVFYEMDYVSGEPSFCTEMHDNDSAGPEWVDPNGVTQENSSPLVWQALEWLKDRNHNHLEVARLDDWMVMEAKEGIDCDAGN